MRLVRPSSGSTRPAWRESSYFTARERAALAFTESVTRLSHTHVPDEAYGEVAAHFRPHEVAALVSLIVMINAWNAIGVSTRAWGRARTRRNDQVPGSCVPEPQQQGPGQHRPRPPRRPARRGPATG